MYSALFVNWNVFINICLVTVCREQIVSIFRRDEANPISEGLSSKVTSFYKIGIRGIKSQCLVLSPDPIHFWNSVILPSDFISRGLQSLFRNDVMLRKLWKVIVVSH